MWLLRCRVPLLEGLIACIGGVDASLSKTAAATLLAEVGPGLSPAPALAEDANAADNQHQLRHEAAGIILKLWQLELG
jgi:hypothetical protein